VGTASVGDVWVEIFSSWGRRWGRKSPRW